MKQILLILALILFSTTISSQLRAEPGDEREFNADTTRLVMKVLDDYMMYFNRMDIDAWESTFHFPHYRLASGTMKVLESPGQQSPDFWKRLKQDHRWQHSEWSRRQIVHMSGNKVHVDTQFRRLRPDGTVIGTFDSLYILTLEDGGWGIKLRSSFAK